LCLTSSFFLKRLHLWSSLFLKDFSCIPSLCNEGGHCVNHLDGNYYDGVHQDRVGCFDGGCPCQDDDAGGLNYGCKRQED
jgi:hypothetical protein